MKYLDKLQSNKTTENVCMDCSTWLSFGIIDYTPQYNTPYYILQCSLIASTYLCLSTITHISKTSLTNDIAVLQH